MRICSVRKFAASFVRSVWTLEDYPVQVWRQWSGYDSNETETAVYVAGIDGWSLLTGAGLSENAAVADLRRQFDAFRAANPLPRPGLVVSRAAGPPTTPGVLPRHDDHLVTAVGDLDRRR